LGCRYRPDDGKLISLIFSTSFLKREKVIRDLQYQPTEHNNMQDYKIKLISPTVQTQLIRLVT